MEQLTWCDFHQHGPYSATKQKKYN